MTDTPIPTASDIRLDYPQFKDIHIYSDRLINKYLALATSRLDPLRWTSQLGYGIELFTVHYLTVKGRELKAIRVPGAVGGEIKGPLTSRTVDGVSNSWDSSAVAITNGGFWNTTIYGVEFIQLARQIGMGGYQL